MQNLLIDPSGDLLLCGPGPDDLLLINPYQLMLSAQEGQYGCYNQVASAQQGSYRIANAIEGYNLWIGNGSPPNMSLPAAAFSPSLPFNATISPPACNLLAVNPGGGGLFIDPAGDLLETSAGFETLFVTVTYQDSYGLNSINQLPQQFNVDCNGNMSLSDILPPQNLLLYAMAGGYIRVLTVYPNANVDANPATTWYVWIGTSPPNTATTPTFTQQVVGQYFVANIGTYTPGLYYVAVGLYRTADGLLSPVVSGTITLTSPPSEVVPVPSGFQES